MPETIFKHGESVRLMYRHEDKPLTTGYVWSAGKKQVQVRWLPANTLGYPVRFLQGTGKPANGDPAFRLELAQEDN